MSTTKTLAKAVKRIALLSGVAMIAISASAIPTTSAFAEGNQQQNWQQRKGPDKGQQGQNHQQNGQGQSHQQWTQQNGNPQGQQQWGQQNGQAHTQPQWTQQNGQTHTQPQWTQQNGGWQGQQWGQQNGQSHNQQQWSQQNGQPRYQGGNGQTHLQGGQQQWSQQNGQQNWQQHNDNHRYNWASYRPGQRPPEWDQYHRNFNPRDYEWARQAERRYHWEPYRAPYGWYYQQWGYGQYLPTAFWVRDYWLDTYWNFGLIDPPYGYVWVRYGPDALLVDVATGQILSVEYGVFYT